MISLSISLEGKAKRDLTKLQRRMPDLLKKAYLNAALHVAGAFEKAQLSGRSSATSGLNRVTGRTLAGNLMASATRAPHQGAGVVAGRIGWIDGHAAMVATVQELGTVGRGGSLPDIVPVRAKFLRFKVAGIKVSAKTGKGKRTWSDFIFAKKVAIPPRLRFRRLMATAGMREIARRSGTEAVAAAIAKAMSNG